MKYYPQQAVVKNLILFTFLEQTDKCQLAKGDSTFPLGSEGFSKTTSLA